MAAIALLALAFALVAPRLRPTSDRGEIRYQIRIIAPIPVEFDPPDDPPTDEPMCQPPGEPSEEDFR